MSELLRNNKPLFIIVAGLFGGLGAWVWATTVGPAPLLEEPGYAIPSYMFLGAIAGFLGVYLIAKTDPAQTAHAIAFSLACGVFWGPVISGAEAMVNRQEVKEAAKSIAVQHDELKATKSELAVQAKALQTSLDDVQRQAEEIDRARRELVALTQRVPQVGPTVRSQLNEINTGKIQSNLATNSRAIKGISGQLDRKLPPLELRVLNHER